jgi:hypothetical protein
MKRPTIDRVFFFASKMRDAFVWMKIIITLYIPVGVKTEAEFFPGFGKRQMFQTAGSAQQPGA